MTRVLAFDQSMSSTGWAMGSETSSTDATSSNPYHYGVIKTPKRDDVGERLAILWREAEGLIDRFDPELICVEEPYFPIQGRGGIKQKGRFVPAAGFLSAEVSEEAEDKNGGQISAETLKQLQMVKGIIVTLAALKGIPTVSCTPSQWRKTVLGYGRKPKGESDKFMKVAVKRHFMMMGFNIKGPDDISDALGILFHCLHGKEAMERKQGNLLDMARGSL